MRIERVLQSPDLRIVSVMVAGIAVFGVVDGSLWRGLLTPTLAYRPAILFALTLVFGWQGLRLEPIPISYIIRSFPWLERRSFRHTSFSNLSGLRTGCCPTTREGRTLAFAGEVYPGISGRRRSGARRAGLTGQHGAAFCRNPTACRRSRHSRWLAARRRRNLGAGAGSVGIPFQAIKGMDCFRRKA